MFVMFATSSRFFPEYIYIYVMRVFFHYGYLIILLFTLSSSFFYYYNQTLLHIIQYGGSTLARQEELKLTSSKTRPPKRLDDCTQYKNASGSMTYIRDRRRLVPTRASLMNSPIKFDQLNLSWPLFALSLFLPHSLSFFIIFFFFLSFFCMFIFFLFFLYVPTFFLYYFCVCMTDFFPIDIAYMYLYIILLYYVYLCLWLVICLYCYQLQSVC